LALGVSDYGPETLRKVHAYLRYASISRSHYIYRSLLHLYLVSFDTFAYLSDQGVPLAANQIQYSLLSRTVGSEVKEVV
jgi:hypothetical protein